MRTVGELSLLSAFVASGFASFALLAARRWGHRGLSWAGLIAAGWAFAGLSVVMGVLAQALLVRDFQFAYVVDYCSQSLPPHYAFSALWVGQAGSLLLWAWLTAALSLLFACWPPARQRRQTDVLGILMTYVCFLVAVMVFAADPMEASLSTARDGVGLSPLLQHPAMLLHPPVIFLGYALWTIPFALAIAALVSGSGDTEWIPQARAWAVAAWGVLGAGILLGADWAYEELGWGGYWAWDPVENGSLIPWLSGTALIHALMAWQYRGVLKKTSLLLAIATFGLCNFATFLTRSGIFSSLHAFSASPIGWLFLALMLLLTAGGCTLLIYRRADLRPDRSIRSVLSREAIVLTGLVAWLLLTVTTIAGTLSAALSNLITGQAVMLGPQFYNYVLIPTGLLLLISTAVVPLLRWGDAPNTLQKRWLVAALIAGVSAVVAAWLGGVRHPLPLSVGGSAAVALVCLLESLVMELRRRGTGRSWGQTLASLRGVRRQYAGFLIHLGFVCLAIGITGSSLGSRQSEVNLGLGEATQWAGYRLVVRDIRQRAEPDKLVAEAELSVFRHGQAVASLIPARHFHRLSQQWTTEVAIHSDWRSDLYVIVHSGDRDQQVRLTLIENPLMRWLWLSGWIMAFGVALRLWPQWPRRHVTDLQAARPEQVDAEASFRGSRAAA